ncbi:MAG: cysteine--tRNA ligase, partial [Actinobacteria bacterium]|nr:cysteine--tRNA ligase [Actinomycetota bacterium]
ASARAMTAVLGLDPLSEQWRDTSGSDARSLALTILVEGLLANRAEARARRDFVLADTVRDRLLAAGIAVEDTPDGPVWTVKGS